MNFDQITKVVSDFVWGIPLIMLILAAGLFLTIRTHFVQIKHFGKSIKIMFTGNNSEGKGEISSFPRFAWHFPQPSERATS